MNSDVGIFIQETNNKKILSKQQSPPKTSHMSKKPPIGNADEKS